ncbi:MAG TPA: hypothetical protein VN737_14665 [Bryobacteraceae bacterium]|nr:hypothetical protein [Bryobacteraceae bacterium]
MILRKRLMQALIVFTLLKPCLAQPSTSTFSLTLKLYKDNVKLGSVIKGEIILTNISGREITVYSDRSRYAHPSGFTINLIDDHGKTPALTDAGSVVIGSGGDQRVPPNGTIEYKLDIQKLYNIVTPGEYHVQAQIIDGKANQLVKSNTVNIAVTR